MIYDKQIAIKLYDQFNINHATYKKMFDYYIGKTDALANYPVTDRSNLKAPNNMIKTFINEEVSFMTGSPITYTSRSSNNIAIDDIEFNLNNINATLDTELATNCLIFGEAYELYYLNNGEFKARVCNPLNAITYEDIEGNVQLFMYFYKKELDDNKVYIDIVDDNYIYHFNDSFSEIAAATPHYFKCVPVGVARLPHNIYDTVYNDIKGLQDIYETILSTWGNEIEDTRLAYMIINGAELDEDTAKNMKAMGIIQTKEADSKISYLIKNIPSDFIMNYRNIIEDEMYKVAQHLKHQVQVQSNTSGTMLANRLICLRNKLTTQQQSLKNCIKTRIKCLFTYLNIAENKNYNYKDIDIKFTLNLPSNDVETAQIISQLTDKLSIETGLEKLSFITNGKAEFEKMLAEKKQIQESEIGDMTNLDKVGGADETI